MQLASIDVTTSFSTLRLLLGLRGMGMGFAMMPVMTFSLQEVPVELTAQASAISNVARPVFAGLGTAVFASLLNSFQKSNLALMVQTATPDSGTTLRILSTFQVYLQQAGMTVEGARQTAVYYLYELTYLRAYVAAFDKVFFIGSMVIFFGVIPALFLYRHNKKGSACRVPIAAVLPGASLQIAERALPIYASSGPNGPVLVLALRAEESAPLVEGDPDQGPAAARAFLSLVVGHLELGLGGPQIALRPDVGVYAGAIVYNAHLQYELDSLVKPLYLCSGQVRGRSPRINPGPE